MKKLITAFVLFFIAQFVWAGYGSQYGAMNESYDAYGGSGNSLSNLVCFLVLCGFAYWSWKKYQSQPVETQKKWRQNISTIAIVVIALLVGTVIKTGVSHSFNNDKPSQPQINASTAQEQSSHQNTDEIDRFLADAPHK